MYDSIKISEETLLQESKKKSSIKVYWWEYILAFMALRILVKFLLKI